MPTAPNKKTAEKARKPGNGSPGPGRPKGAQNKLTKDIKAMILGALEAMDGQAYLEKIAKEDPRVFCGLLGRLIPVVTENTNTNYNISDKPATEDEWEAEHGLAPAGGASTLTH